MSLSGHTRCYNVSSDASETVLTEGKFSSRMAIPGSHNRIALLACSIPRSWTTIKSGQNTFSLGATEYTLPVQNYSAQTLATAFTTAASGAGTLTYNSATGRYTLTTAQSSITCVSARLRRCLGLSSEVTAVATSLTFPNVAYLSSATELWICCTAVQGDSPSDQVPNALSHVFVNANADLSTIQWTNPAPRYSSRPLRLDNAPLRPTGMFLVQWALLDDLEEAVSMRGCEISLQVATWWEPEQSPWELLRSWAIAWQSLETARNAVQNGQISPSR